jgi:hypothetical protein
VELGVIELRVGKPPKLAVESENEDTAALKAKLEAVGGPGGIPLDMHLPPTGGEKRGAYGTRIVKYDDPLYRHALTQALEPDFSVKEVPGLAGDVPPAALKRMHVSRSGEKVGTLDFTASPPTLTLHSSKADAESFRNAWDAVQERGALKVRFHHPKDRVETLVTLQAKPGDASYPQAVVLYLILERYYQARYAYQLAFE